MTTRFLMASEVVIDMLLGTKIIDEHIFAILPEERKVIVCDSNPVALIEQVNLTVNSVFNNKHAGNTTKKTLRKSGNDQEGLKTVHYHSSWYASGASTICHNHYTRYDKTTWSSTL